MSAGSNGEIELPPGEAAIRQVKSIRERLNDLERENEAIRRENENLREEIERQRSVIAEIDKRTDILEVRDRVDKLSAEERRARLLLHLKNKAENRNGPSVGAITAEEWKKHLDYPDGLHPSVFNKDLSRTYEYNSHCQALSYNNGELVLDLREGDAPTPAVTDETAEEVL